MAYPIIYRELAELDEDESLHTAMARAVARKAGLRRGVSSPATARTLIDTYVVPAGGEAGASEDMSNFAYTFEVNLTGATQIRTMSQSVEFVYVYVSRLGVGSTVLDPGDWVQLRGTYSYGEDRIFSNIEDFEIGDLFWATLSDEDKVPLRVGLGTDVFAEGPQLETAEHFSFAMQVL